MFLLMRLAAISFVTLAALVQVSAQGSDPPLPFSLPQGFRVDELTEDAANGRLFVRGSIIQPDGAIVPGQSIICERDTLRDGAMLIWQDRAALTDDRVKVDADVCGSLARAMRRLEEMQER
jgi:hypothetical protein